MPAEIANAAKESPSPLKPMSATKSGNMTSLVTALEGRPSSLSKTYNSPRKRALFTFTPSSPSNASASTDSLLCGGDSLENSPSKVRKIATIRSSTSSSSLRAAPAGGLSPAPIVLGAGTKHSADSQGPASAFKDASLTCQVCGVVYSSAKLLTSHVLAVHGGDSRLSKAGADLCLPCDPAPRRPAGNNRNNPERARSGSPSTQSDESCDDEAVNVMPSPVSGPAVKSGKASSGTPGKARKNTGKSRPPAKRQPVASSASGGAVRTRPTNNQLLYKAHFRWEHYPHAINGSRQLPTETEACASVTSAFLQVLSSLHKAESNRKDSPRNILQILSTNTRRTKVVELSSGTHRVPDELRKHCLDDANGREYSTNLDRNRYGSDNQYLNTVIRYDLDFLGLCPCLVDVEIIDAKDDDKTVLIQADLELCNCGCDKTSEEVQRRAPSVAKPEPSQGSGMFDMLLLAATSEALEREDDASADNEAETAVEQEETNKYSPATKSPDENKDSKPLAVVAPVASKRPIISRQGSVSGSVGRAEGLQAALVAAEANISALQKAKESEAKKHAAEAQSLKERLMTTELRVKQLETNLEAMKEGRTPTSPEDSAEGSGTCDVSEAMKNHCAELEAKLAAVIHERDVHAASHSYYAIWVQQLQAEVTNLLKAHAQSGGGLSSVISAQLLSLTQAANPSTEPSALHPAINAAEAATGGQATPAEDPDTEAGLRAQYEKQLEELLHQHFQTLQQTAQPSQLPTLVHKQLTSIENPLKSPSKTSSGSNLGIAPLSKVAMPDLFKSTEPRTPSAAIAAAESLSRVASPAPIAALAAAQK